MAACGEGENVSTNEDLFHGSISPMSDSKQISRSPSSSSFDQWPYLMISKRSHNFRKSKHCAHDTIYLCNFRVSVDGEWLCLKELQDVEFTLPESFPEPSTPSPVENPMILARDPVMIERRNLVNISKLIVKELIETSLKYGRMLDSDHMPLQHFFIVLEHVLRHGLRPKKGLLGPKKELWDILQMVEKLTLEAQDITTSVRDLPTVRTHMGRARAWLRLALMQKKLADYLKILIDHRDDILSEYFEPDALMMSEEANVIEGLLTGLNVIDCNLCVKEEDLDCQQGVIDFSLYLRSSHHLSTEDSPEDEFDPDNMTTVLDQKNYIEELNRHLNATVGNLQAKVESLTTTNALMKEDLAIAKNNILGLMEENANLKAELSDSIHHERTDEGGGGGNGSGSSITAAAATNGKETDFLQQQLENEQKLRQEAEKELQLQVSLKAEMEVAMKLLEKDIHEKQDTIISLRRQLDDIKIINLEMYKKLQECEGSLKHKTELIAKLEAKTIAMTDTIQKMEKKQKEVDEIRTHAELALHKAGEITSVHEEKRGELEGELKVEREWRLTMQGTIAADREKIAHLQEEVAQLKAVATKYVELQEEHYRLSEQCREQEMTLEELGCQLSVSKLQVSDLKEEFSVTRNKDTALWTSDKGVTHCKSCNKEFNITRRKHHCRNCGEIFCNSCSDNSTLLPSSAKPVRVCDECYVQLVARNSVIQ